MLFKVIKPCYVVKMLCGQYFTLLLTIGLSLFSLRFQTARRVRVSWWRSRACWWRSWRWWRKETNWWVCWTSNGWRRKPRTEIWRAWSSPEAISSTGPELLTLDEELLEWPARTTLDWEPYLKISFWILNKRLFNWMLPCVFLKRNKPKTKHVPLY